MTLRHLHRLATMALETWEACREPMDNDALAELNRRIERGREWCDRHEGHSQIAQGRQRLAQLERRHEAEMTRRRKWAEAREAYLEAAERFVEKEKETHE